jgi:membrane-bound ClpP family serine protease
MAAFRWLGVVAVLLLAAWPTAKAQDKAAAPTASTAPSNQSLAIPAERQADKVVVITIHEAIDQVMYESIKRRMTLAERGGADAIVFDINTPGGEVGAVIEICDLIKKSTVRNTVAWVNSEAISGGAIIALACREIVMGNAGHIGNAMPIVVEQFTGRAKTPPQSELQKKILPVLLGNVLDSVRRHNEAAGRYEWDEFLAQAMVVNDLQLWWVKHKETGVFMAVDRREAELLFPGQSLDGPARLPGGAAPSTSAGPSTTSGVGGPTGGPVAFPSGSSKLAGVSAADVASHLSATTFNHARPVITQGDIGKYELLGRINDGSAAAFLSASDAAHYNFAANATRTGDVRTLQPIRTDADLKQYFAAKHLTRVDRSWSEGLVVFLTNPIVRGVFFVIFIIALFIELSHPGVTLPGVVAIIALALALVPSALIGMAGWWTIVAILAGLLMLGLEVFVLPGMGIAGIAGAILLFAGLIGAFIGAGGLFPDTDAERASRMWGMTTLLGGMFTAGVAIYFIAKHLDRVPMLNKLVLANTSPDDEESGGLLAAMEDENPHAARIGEVGVTITPLRPAGKIEINGRVLDAVAEMGFLDIGTSVRVVSATEFRIGVEQVRSNDSASGKA